MKPVEFLTVGDLHEDYIITHEDRACSQMIGGSAIHAAAGARIWSDSVGLLARVGSNYPDELVAQIRQADISVDCLKILPYREDTRAFYAYSSPREITESNPAAQFLRIGERLPKNLVDWKGRESNTELSPHPQDLSAELEDLASVHLGQASYQIHTAFIIRLRELGAKIISLDPSDTYMQPGQFSRLQVLLNDLDALLASEEQVRSLFQPSPPGIREMVERLSQMGCPVIVLHRGPLGLYVWDRSRSALWQIPAYPARVTDSTGETYAFAGGFLTGLASTGDPLEAALRGSVSASMSIEGIGALFPLDCAPGLASARLEALRESAKQI
jgi:ribokinase